MGHQIQAHKIILSAGSNFFSNILRQTKHSSPFIYLKGINRVELEYVIDFLYNGEAYVAQEELNKFLEIAQELQVKGLQSNQEDESGQRPSVNTKLDVEAKFTDKETINTRNQGPVLQEGILDSLEQLAYTFEHSDVALVQKEETNLALDIQIEQMMEKNEGLWKCKVCGKTGKNKAILKIHTETHIEGFSHTCHICNKTLSTRNSLNVHINNIHSDIFTCNVCGKSGMNRMALSNHKNRTCKILQ